MPFIHNDLEEVCMKIPLSYDRNIAPICILRKTLYGLKQSLVACFERFNRTLVSTGYQQNNSLVQQELWHSIVYVDDKIVTGNGHEGRPRLGQHLKYFLGIGVAWSKQGIFVSPILNRSIQLIFWRTLGK